MDGEELEIGDPRDDDEASELDRGTIALRAVFSLLLALVLSVLNSLLAVVVIFQLVYSFVSRSIPSPRVQELGNNVTAYYYQALRYLTHNDSQTPFPFSDFPTPLEVGRSAYAPAAGAHAADPETDAESPT